MMWYLVFCLFFLPLASFLSSLLLPQSRQVVGAWIATLVMLLATGLSAVVAMHTWGQASWQWQFVWVGGIRMGWRIDSQAAFMLVVVTSISALVHLFSLTYLRGDAHYGRYFAYLGLFTFAKLGIVLADNLLMMYVFWELVGLASYLLIGFWQHKRAAVQAAKKAFLVNRLGDALFLVGVILWYQFFGTWDFVAVAEQLATGQSPEKTIAGWQMTVLGFCLLGGAMGKSAQFPLHIWLPDAMEGPTPVSALIHAATMVAAGVFLLARVFFLLTPPVLIVVAFVGAITICLGGFAALVQRDIKKVLAYSTMSQLGYMMVAVGVGAPEVALFHLLTHAFFKAGLFLSAGAIIHALHRLAHTAHCDFDAQNIQLMGGLSRRMPLITAVFLICSASLVGLPFFSGFLSKEAILAHTWAWARVLGAEALYVVPMAAFAGTLLTAMYMGRLVWRIFGGTWRLPQYLPVMQKYENSLSEGDIYIHLPLLALAVGSLGFVFSLNPLSHEGLWFLAELHTPYNGFVGKANQTALLHEAHHLQGYTTVWAISLATLGLAMAYWLGTRPQSPRLAQMPRVRRVFAQGFYIDQLYAKVGIALGWRIAQFSAWCDKNVIDATVNLLGRFPVVLAHLTAFVDRWLVDGVVNGSAALASQVGAWVQNARSGSIQVFITTAIVMMVVLGWWFG